LDPIAAPSSLGTPWPDLKEFSRSVNGDAALPRPLKQLHSILTACEPGAALAQRIETLEALGEWLRARRGLPAPPNAGTGEQSHVLRLRWLLLVLERVPAVKERLSRTLHSVFAEGLGLGLFGRLGLPTDRGLFAETVDRISRSFLPEARDDRDLTEFVGRIFPRQHAINLLRATPPGLVRELAIQLRDLHAGINPWAPLREHLLDAVALLGTRVAGVGLSDVLRARSPEVRLTESPFFELPRALDNVISAITRTNDPRRSGAPVQVTDLVRHVRTVMDACRAVTASVIENLDRTGVSVDVVFRIELIGSNLDRLDRLLRQLDYDSRLEASERALELLVELASLRLKDRKLGDILGRNVHLLARKIIERAGHSGEHYITSSRGEYFKMLVSAGGGGALTAGTTALKYTISAGHFAPFVDGVLSACNYAGSFIVMQLLGFTLATKQPSMTAAALAGTLRQKAGHGDLSELVAMIARIVRSQLAAALGNLGLVIPAAFAFNMYWATTFGRPFLQADTARYVLQSLDPLHGGTVFFAALTGCLLWVSSIAAGWLENWAVYRRLPQAIETHRLGRWVGRGTMRMLSRFFQRNIAGFGGNTALGALLAMTPVMGKFFGLPLDVRHITLSTGALTLAVCTLGVETLGSVEFRSAAIGIAVIGLMNFGVSFALALAVALRAREVQRADQLRLFWSVLGTFVRSPLQFFIPPAGSAPTVHAPASVRPGPHS
jgi:site-specific recombinase